MEYIVGITLALLFCGAAVWLGMDRERVFYPPVVDGRNGVMLSEAAAGAFVALLMPGARGRFWGRRVQGRRCC